MWASFNEKNVRIKNAKYSAFVLNLSQDLRPQACNFIRTGTLAQVFSCKFCEISENTFFTEHLWTTASKCSKSSKTMILSKFIPIGKKTSCRCLEDVFSRQARYLTKTSCRCPKDFLNANLKDIFVRHLEETFARYILDVLQKTS